MSMEMKLLPCPFCGGEAKFERVGNARQSCIVACEDCSCRLETNEVFHQGSQWNTRASAAPEEGENWIDQNHQIDRYGVALMMIREGCADPSGLARRILSEFHSDDPAALSPDSRKAEPGQREFPYQQTFDAIAAATSLWPSKDAVTGISISVSKFQEAFNNHRDAALNPATEDITRAKLRKLVDIVWNEATESTAVPSTKWADKLSARALSPSPSVGTPAQPSAQGKTP